MSGRRKEIESHKLWDLHEFLRVKMIEAGQQRRYEREKEYRRHLTGVAIQIANELNLPNYTRPI